MEELEISGKRYISTRRAAREHGYHSDYMGQLIRGNKVAGQKVGRAWYIEEESLSRYLGKESVRQEQLEQRVQSEQQAQGAQPAQHVSPVQADPTEEEKQTGEKILEEQKVEKDVPEPEPVREEVAEVKEEEGTRIYIHKPAAEQAQAIGGLRYVPDDIPAIPVVTRMPQPREYHEHATAYAQPEIPRNVRTLPYVSLSIVAVAAIVGAIFVSNFVSATIVSEEGKAASVRYAIHW